MRSAREEANKITRLRNCPRRVQFLIAGRLALPEKFLKVVSVGCLSLLGGIAGLPVQPSAPSRGLCTFRALADSCRDLTRCRPVLPLETPAVTALTGPVFCAPASDLAISLAILAARRERRWRLRRIL